MGHGKEHFPYKIMYVILFRHTLGTLILMTFNFKFTLNCKSFFFQALSQNRAELQPSDSQQDPGIMDYFDEDPLTNFPNLSYTDN